MSPAGMSRARRAEVRSTAALDAAWELSQNGPSASNLDRIGIDDRRRAVADEEERDEVTLIVARPRSHPGRASR